MLRNITFIAVLIWSSNTWAKDIPLNHEFIAYRGALYPEISETKVIPYRFPHSKLFPKTFSERPTYSIKSGASRTGTSIIIRTDSPAVKLRFEYEGAQFATFAVQRNGGSIESIRVNNPNGADLILKNETPGQAAEYRITGPAAAPVYALVGVEIDDGCELIAPSSKRGKVYVALGDSISHGLRKDNTCQTWPWLTAEGLGMEFYNIAVGGSNANVGQVIPVTKLPEIDLMTVLWGYNDCINKGKTVEEYIEDMNAVLDEIRKHHSDTPIFILNLLQTKMHKSKKNDLTIDDFRVAVRYLTKSRQADGDKNIHLIAAETMTNKEGDLNDVVHLSHAGEEKLAKAVVAEIKKVISQPSKAQ